MRVLKSCFLAAAPLPPWLGVAIAMSSTPSEYTPPVSREELVRRYTDGERHFPGTDLSDLDLSGIKLDGASFERFSWFFNATFEGASLVGTSFWECNVKCASFRGENLTGASFELAAIESIDLEGANIEGAQFLGATCYGCTVDNENEPPPT